MAPFAHIREKLDRLASGVNPAFFFLITAGICISNCRFPRFVADRCLDPSWQQMLCHNAGHSLQAGSDYVFTYGPLGWLDTMAYQPGLSYPRVSDPLDSAGK